MDDGLLTCSVSMTVVDFWVSVPLQAKLDWSADPSNGGIFFSACVLFLSIILSICSLPVLDEYNFVPILLSPIIILWFPFSLFQNLSSTVCDLVSPGYMVQPITDQVHFFVV